jgi:hypothetical protein
MRLLLGLVLAFAPICVAMAQGPSAAQPGVSSSPAAAEPDFAPLKGTWIRPDGGYVIAITSVSPGGKIEATYFNPNRLPFAKAQATRDGATLRVFFELRAGGYGGSTYELTYDPASDQLKGIYYQAVAKQKFAIFFARK